MPFHCNDDFRVRRPPPPRDCLSGPAPKLTRARLPQNYYRVMSTDNLKFYLRDMFRALRATHARGIIHRDVKPANFLFDCNKQFGVLVDYGLAQVRLPCPGSL